jgi:hypothetical protein
MGEVVMGEVAVGTVAATTGTDPRREWSIRGRADVTGSSRRPGAAGG